LDYVKAYRQAGNPALMEYHDQENPVLVANEYRFLLEQSRFLTDYAPEFHKYLEEFPKASSPNVEEFICWSKETYGLKPVLHACGDLQTNRWNQDRGVGCLEATLR
jgi:hypothetical protein